MSTRLSALRIVDPLLSELAIGYANEAFIGLKVVLPVTVAKEEGKFAIFGKERFQYYGDEIKRAPRAQRARGDWTVTAGTYALEESSFEIPIDLREREEASDPVQPERESTFLCMEVIRLKMEKDHADLVFTAANYAAGHKATLATGARWSVAGSDPIGDVETAKNAVRAAVGAEPNAMVLGAKTWRYLRHHADIIERYKYSREAILTPKMVAAVFDLEDIFIGKGVYSTDEGATMTDLWGAHAALIWLPTPLAVGELGPELGPKQPAFAKTFHKKGRPRSGRYPEERANSDVVWCEDLWQAAVTLDTAGYLYTNAGDDA